MLKRDKLMPSMAQYISNVNYFGFCYGFLPKKNFFSIVVFSGSKTITHISDFAIYNIK